MTANDKITRKAEMLLFLAVLVLALAPRLWCLFHNQLQEGDAGNYLEVGRNLAEGRGYTTYAKWDFYGDPSGPVVHPEGNRQPFLPLVAAATFALGAKTATPTAVATVLVSLAAIALAYVCIRRWLGPAWALAGIAILAVEPAFLWFSVRAQTEAYFVLLFFAALAVAGDLEGEKPSFIRPLIVGVLLSLAYLCRINGALLLVAYVVALIAAYRGKGILAAALATAAFAAVAAPWWVRNANVFGDPFYSQAKYFVLAPQFDDVWSIKRHVPTWGGFFASYGVVGFVGRYVRGLWRAVEPFFLGNLHFNEPYEGAPLAAFVLLSPFAAALLRRRRALLFPGLALLVSILGFAFYGHGLYRYFLPFYLVIIPLGLAGAWRTLGLLGSPTRWAKVGFTLLLLAPFVRPLLKTLAQDDRAEYKQIHAVAAWLAEYSSPGNVVVTWPRVIELLYEYDRPSLYWPAGTPREVIWVLGEYNVRYVVVEPLALAQRPGLSALWYMGPEGLTPVPRGSTEAGNLTLASPDYGGAAFRQVFRPEGSNVAVYEVDQEKLRATVYGVYVGGVR